MIKFETKDNQFYLELRKRVNQYFKEKNISKSGNYRIWIKTIVMVLLYFIPYVLFFTVSIPHVSIYLVLWFIMGIAMAGIGLGVMHDANHGSFSSSTVINKILGRSINFLGGHNTNWIIQHNVLHHTYTNVHGLDEDLEIAGIMRFSPHQKRRSLHRFQHYYAWFFYGLMTLSWMSVKDFKQLIRYDKRGLLAGQKTSLTKEMTRLIIYRSVYIFYTLIVPLIFSPFLWWQTLIGFIIMHFTAGFILSCIFQTAHVMETSEYENAQGENIKRHWAVHQILNTSNYAQKSTLFSWYAGGLNFQIEHHLFPSISHVHYKKISEIIQNTAREFGLPYHSNTTFWQAIKIHFNTLKTLGKYNQLQTV